MNNKKHTLLTAARHKYQHYTQHNQIYRRHSAYNLVVPITESRALLFNSISRALCLLTPEELAYYDSLAHGAIPASPAERLLCKQLSVDGFLIADKTDEFAAIEQHYWQQRNNTQRLGLTIAPTMGCNLACTYCFQGQEKEKASLTPALIEQINQLVDLRIAEINQLSITWYGGEPLMKSAQLFALSEQLIKKCQQHNVNYHCLIVTNGMFLTADIADKLQQHGCSMAQVTLDGPQAIHDKMRPTLTGKGSFARIVQNVADVLRETQLPISLRVNVGKDNLDCCGELLDELELRGLHQYPQLSLYFAPIDASTEKSGSAFEQSLSQQHFFQALTPHRQRAKQLGLMSETQSPYGFSGLCVATMKNDMVLAPNGEIHKCWETMHEPSMRVGVLNKEQSTAAERQTEQFNTALWEQWTPFANPVCSECKMLPLCGGRCAQRFVYFGEGGEHSLPCPEWKWHTAELIFERALEQGSVVAEDWLAAQSTAITELTGKRHAPASMQQARDDLYAQVKNVTPIS